MTRTTKRVVITVVVILAIIAAAIVATSVTSFSNPPDPVKDGRIDRWSGGVEVEDNPDIAYVTDSETGEVVDEATEPTVSDDATTDSERRRRCGHKCRVKGKVKRWRYRVGGGAFRTTLDAAVEDAEALVEDAARRGSDCRRVSITSAGGNAAFHNVVVAGLSGSWCWNHGKIRKHRMNTWHDEAGWALWQFKGSEVFAKVCKEGKHLKCGRVYRRVGFEWRRGLGSFSQGASTWAAYSLRPRGSYSWDKK